MNDLRDALYGALSTNLEVRKQSESLLKAAQKQPDVVRQLPAFFSDADPMLRKLSSVFYKNAIIEEWPLGTYSQHKRFFIDNLLYVVMQCDCNLVSEVEKVLDCIVQTEDIDEISTVFNHALSLLQSGNEREFAAALVFFKKIASISKVIHFSKSFEKLLQPAIAKIVGMLKVFVQTGMFAYAKWVVSIITAVHESQSKFFDHHIEIFEDFLQTISKIIDLRFKNDTTASHQQEGMSNELSQYLDDPRPMSFSYLRDFQQTTALIMQQPNASGNPTDLFGVVTANQNVIFVEEASVQKKYAYARTGGRTPGDQLHLLQAACIDFLSDTYGRAGKRRAQGRVSELCVTESVLATLLTRIRAQLGWHVPLLTCEPVSGTSAGSRPRDRLVRACICFLSELTESKTLRRNVLADAQFIALGVALPLLRFSAADARIFYQDPSLFLRERYSLYAGDARAHSALLLADVRRRLRGSDEGRLTSSLMSLLPSHASLPSLNISRTIYAVLHCLAAAPRPGDSLVSRLLSALQSDIAFLRSQACHCLQYCDPDDVPLPDLSTGLDRVLAETSSQIAVSRVDALVATAFFFSVDALRPKLEGAAPSLVRQLLEAQRTCEVEAIGSTLESLIAHFPRAVASTAPSLVSQLCSLMLPSLGNGNEELVHTHQTYLRTIQGLVFAFQTRAPKKDCKYKENSGDFIEETAENMLLNNIDLRSPLRASASDMATYRSLAQSVLPFFVPVLTQIFSRFLSDLYEEALQLLGEAAFCLRNSDQTIWGLTRLALAIPHDDRALVSNDLVFALENVMSFSTHQDILSNIQQIQGFYEQMASPEDGYADGDDDFSLAVVGFQSIIIHLGPHALPLIPRFLSIATSYDHSLDVSFVGYTHLMNLISTSILLSFETTMDFLLSKNLFHKYIDELAENTRSFARVYDICILILLCTFFMSNGLQNIHCLSEILNHQDNHFLHIYQQITANSEQKNSTINKYDIFSSEIFAKKISHILTYAVDKLPSAILHRKKIIQDENYEYDNFDDDSYIEEDAHEETFVDYLQISSIMRHALSNLNSFGQVVTASLPPSTVECIKKYLH